MKFGVDYRRITSKTGLYAYTSQAIFSTLGKRSRQHYAAGSVISRNDDVQIAFTNVSIFAQDTWKVTRTLDRSPTGCAGSTTPRRRRRTALFRIP